MREMEQHLTYLDTFCRLCGEKITKGYRKKYRVNAAARKLMENHIDISNDDPEIHPKWMCGACRGSLTLSPKVARLVKWKRVLWSKHSDVQCPTCTLGENTIKMGRPKKRINKGRPRSRPVIPPVPSSLSSLESEEFNPCVFGRTLGESPQAALFADIDMDIYAIEIRCKYCHCLVHVNNVNTHSCTKTMTALDQDDDTVTSTVEDHNPPAMRSRYELRSIKDERPPMEDGGWVVADQDKPIPMADQGDPPGIAGRGDPPPIADQHDPPPIADQRDPPPKGVVASAPSQSRNVVLLNKDNFDVHCKQCKTSFCFKNMKDHVCASKEAVERDHSYSRTNSTLIDLTPQELEGLTLDVLRKKWKESDDGATAILSTGGGGVSGRKICAKRVKIADLQAAKEEVKNEKKTKLRHTSTQTMPHKIHLSGNNPILYVK